MPFEVADTDLGRLRDTDLVGPWKADSATGGHRDLTEVHPQIFVGPVFTPQWCERVRREVERYRAWSRAGGAALSAPNTMHRGGVLLSQLGMQDALASLMRVQVQDFADAHLAEHLDGPLVDCHAYVVTYEVGREGDLGFHVDASQITLNLCLGEASFEGAELYFQGPRCAMHVDSPSRKDEAFVWTHQPGVALLHAGKNRHGVRPIRRGRRMSLIAWFRDETGRQRWEHEGSNRHCPDWCGESEASLNRRG